MVLKEGRRAGPLPILGGAAVGTLVGQVGLGGAGVRPPLRIGVCRFAAPEAVIVNKAISPVVVASAPPCRAGTMPLADVAGARPVILNLAAGSVARARAGAGWATRMRADVRYRVIAALLVLIAAVLVFGHEPAASGPLLTGPSQRVAGLVAGFGIGVAGSLMGVAGGERLVPTPVLLFGAAVKLAGSLSLAVSLRR